MKKARIAAGLAVSGSPTWARTRDLGGDLAYWYGKNGSLTGMNVSAAQDVINAANFGAGNQNLRAFSGISGGMATLA